MLAGGSLLHARQHHLAVISPQFSQQLADEGYLAHDGCENTAQWALRWGQLAFHQDSCIFLYEHQMPCQMIKKRLQEFLSPLQVTALQGNGDETASNSYYW